MNEESEKLCFGPCKQTLPVSEFGLRVTGKPRPYCRECENKMAVRRYSGVSVVPPWTNRLPRLPEKVAR